MIGSDEAVVVGPQQSVSCGLNFGWVMVTTNEGKRQLHMQWSSKYSALPFKSNTDTMHAKRVLLFPNPQNMQAGFPRAARL